MGNGFLYFAEIMTPQVTLEDVQSLGLGYAFDAKPTACRVMTGPNGEAGSVFARHQAAAPVGFYPDLQTWRQAESGDFWIGHNGPPPTPADLERLNMLKGRRVEMADGHEWLVPVARSVDDSQHVAVLTVPQLPCRVERQDGEWVMGEVLDKYRGLWDTANRLFDEYANAAESGEEKFFVAFDEAVEAIAANYYVGTDEAAALGLFTSTGEELQRVLHTLIDLQSLIDRKKKKTLADSETSTLGATG